MSGKPIQIWKDFQEIDLANDPILYKNWIRTHEVRMDDFSKNRSDSWPGKLLDEFPRIFLPRNPCPTFYQPHQDTKIDKIRVRLFRARENRRDDRVLRPTGGILVANCEFVPRHLHHHKLHMA